MPYWVYFLGGGMNEYDVNGGITAMIDKNNLVSVDWVEVEKKVNDYLNGDKSTPATWCFVLWNVKHCQARSLNG